ncbi:MAG TPA: hypothetical protein VEH84_14560 [Alphaproteobacteria bacterium]|nr:hypothetical protein [Alphaproteobacteria bacterium]
MSGTPNARPLRKPFSAELAQLKRLAESGRIPAEAATASLAAPALAAPAAAAVDNSQVLSAIAELGHKLDRFIAIDQTEIEKIQIEVSDISGRIKATKAEMAALRHPLAEEDKFQQASEELSYVVSATENATNKIMSCAEQIEDIVNELKTQLGDGYQSSRLNDITEIIVGIYESCNFQDLTGQRIDKVVRAVAFIEERVESMMALWNKKEFETMPLPPSTTKKDGDLDLHGPNERNLEKGMISQADIDALFD